MDILNELIVQQYNSEYKEEWDNFIEKSKNGTFLHKIDYMHYHIHRFQDCSLLIKKKNKVVAVLPGNIVENAYYSHQGLTYGGLITLPETKAEDVINYFEIVNKYLKEEKNVSQVIYKSIPHIYASLPAEEDEYALFLLKAEIVSTGISSVIRMENKLPFSSSRMGCIKKSRKNDLIIKEDYSYKDFWGILSENLKLTHNTKPVHSLEEIILLKGIFNENIKLFSVYDYDECIAGAVIYITNNVAHVQYISANNDGKKVSALDLLFAHLIEVVYKDIEFFDFGTSVENGGYELNKGLIFQKQGFGARAINYKAYKYNI